MKRKTTFILIIFGIAAVVILPASLFIATPDESDNNGISFKIDTDDVNICLSEKSHRASMGSYESRVNLFVSKSLDDDDRDHDGISTLENCCTALCNSYLNDNFPAKVLEYIQNEYMYTTDQELYSSFDWAAYPIETIFKEAGDCEDLVILAVAILNHCGYKCGIALFHNHAIALIAEEFDDAGTSDKFSKFTLTDNGTIYSALETTCVCPPGYTFSEYGASDILAYKIVNA